MYRLEGLTGIDSFLGPIEFTRLGSRKAGDFSIAPPQYKVVRVPWGGANQDDVASLVTRKHPEKVLCPYCRVGVSGRWQEKVMIEEGSWDGTDIFRPRGAPVSYMVSKRFKDIVEEHQVTNAWLIPSHQYGFDEFRRGLFYVHE